ncbi:MAG TPA: GTPase [Streptosporangiaceae bacterium]|nr:GTPase [Streptosporangiaceae bacterium]
MLAAYDGDAAQQATGLSARLMALARMIQIGSARSGRDGFSKKLLGQAEDVLGRAGERMRLSSAHTVVVLAGGTGSGKSSLFNRLAGADFSTVGVTRPVTKDAHACIWDDNGSGALLEWLGIPQRDRYSRASALGGGESGLAGLVLLDLPDHDSVMGHATGQVDRLVSLADVMVWVLDPQKYADAAVHLRFLIPLAGHSDVQAVVLNQADLLTAAQVDDCVSDLRRLLDSENLQDVPILVASAVTGLGIEDLRRLLAEGVAARRGAAARISADVDTVVARFARYAGERGKEPESIAPESVSELVAEFYTAAGVTAIGDSLRSVRELRAADFVGWPVAWLVQRLSGRDPLRKIRLGALWNDLRSVSAGPAGAQQAAIDNALTRFADQVAEPLPRPWSATVRAAARSHADEIPALIGAAIGEAMPAEDNVASWWRAAGLWQGFLLGAATIGLAWAIALLVIGGFHAAHGLPALLTDPIWILWALLAVAVALAAGAFTASACMSSVRTRAAAETAELAADIKKRIDSVAREMAVAPAAQELREFDRYCEDYAIASKEASAQESAD